MKRVILAVSIVCIVFASNVFAYSGGSGTQAYPCQIANVADFQQLSATPADWNKSFILTANIDLTGLTFNQDPIAPDANTEQWGFQGTPFTGVFDGKGHTISNLTITASTKNCIGLFGYVGSGGQIRNLGIENANITGYSYVGGLVGISNGEIIGCYATGSVSGITSYVGGLVGENYGTLSGCYATDSVSGTGDHSYVGGLVGTSDGMLTGCYATGSVSGTGDYSYVGGLVGISDGTLTGCYATGSVSGTGDYSYVGGLVGKNFGGTLIGCFWDTQTSNQTNGVGQGSSDGVYGRTTAEMKQQATFTASPYLWHFLGETTADGPADYYWRMCVDGVDYPKFYWQYSFKGDLDCPDGVGFEDMLFLSQRWLQTTVNPFEGADITGDSTVNFYDYAILASHWLESVAP